jgi:hypothetical protein
LLSSLLLLTDSGGPAAFYIHDVPIVLAAAVISDVNSVAAIAGRFVSVPSVLAVLLAFIPDVACISAVVGRHAIALILAVA